MSHQEKAGLDFVLFKKKRQSQHYLSFFLYYFYLTMKHADLTAEHVWMNNPALANHLRSLDEFYAEVKEHPSNALSSATNSFLDSMALLIDSEAKQDVNILKKIIHAVACVFPYVFMTM